MGTNKRRTQPRRNVSIKRKIRGRIYDTLPDIPDIRDRIYEPSLAPLQHRLPQPRALHILDQGTEGACTGFALAAAINYLLVTNRGNPPALRRRRVSPHMLYVMAKRYDEWPGDDYEGSSLRGALKGFFNMGATAEQYWPSKQVDDLSLEAAKDARTTSLGAYYRLRPVLSDYHAAITETGVIYASASVHSGWDDSKGDIPSMRGEALHAFAIVGYDDKGFWVQNSWGKGWGSNGVAHWKYQDWAANIADAWVLQLAVPAPRAFGLGFKRDDTTSAAELSGATRAPPTRSDIAGHFVHVNDGNFFDQAPYWSNRNDVESTAKLVGTSNDYDNLMFYAHGGLNTTTAAAIRTSAMSGVFMQNRIYPYSIFYDTGLVETLLDVISGQGAAMQRRAGGRLDFLDAVLEKLLRGIGSRLWKEMKADAGLPFNEGRDGETALRLFAQHLAGSRKGMHLVAHSNGAILIGHLLDALDRVLPKGASIDSVSLMAPACSIRFYEEKFRSRLNGKGDKPVKIDRLTMYCLSEQAELDDHVARVYRKSLLWLVSNAFEAEKQTPILGMKEFHKQISPKDPLTIYYSDTDKDRTASTSHGGFDNDPFTMNDILRSILGKKPSRPFAAQDLNF